MHCRRFLGALSQFGPIWFGGTKIANTDAENDFVSLPWKSWKLELENSLSSSPLQGKIVSNVVKDVINVEGGWIWLMVSVLGSMAKINRLSARDQDYWRVPQDSEVIFVELYCLNL